MNFGRRPCRGHHAIRVMHRSLISMGYVQCMLQNFMSFLVFLSEVSVILKSAPADASIAAVQRLTIHLFLIPYAESGCSHLQHRLRVLHPVKSEVADELKLTLARSLGRCSFPLLTFMSCISSHLQYCLFLCLALLSIKIQISKSSWHS